MLWLRYPRLHPGSSRNPLACRYQPWAFLGSGLRRNADDYAERAHPSAGLEWLKYAYCVSGQGSGISVTVAPKFPAAILKPRMSNLPSPLASPKGRVSSGMLTTSPGLMAATGILTGA